MSRGMVIEYFPVGSLMLFILPQVFLGGTAVPDRAVTGDPHGQRSALGEKPVAAWIRGAFAPSRKWPRRRPVRHAGPARSPRSAPHVLDPTPFALPAPLLCHPRPPP